jgi:hypothetical protein
MSEKQSRKGGDMAELKKKSYSAIPASHFLKPINKTNN